MLILWLEGLNYLFIEAYLLNIKIHRFWNCLDRSNDFFVILRDEEKLVIFQENGKLLEDEG